jgi:hypothetical protein
MKSENAHGGIGFLGLLAIVFIALKLMNCIAWSWWWILAPLWMPTAIFVAILVLIFAIAVAADLVHAWRK